jgi:putative hydrolase of the HAD superfamily
LTGRVGAVRAALGAGWARFAQPFPGYRELLLAARDLGLRRVIVSNTNFTATRDWRDVIAPAVGLDGLLDGIVTSYDVRYRKPHLAMFERALEIAGHSAPECVMIGNDERKDVVPAKELGMFVIRVAIQEPPTPTRADRLVTSLDEAREALTNA